MRAKLYVNAPGVLATFDGTALAVTLRENPAKGVSVSPIKGGPWEVRDYASGTRLGTLDTLEEAAVRSAGLSSFIARLMRGAVEAAKQVDGEPSVETWSYMEARAEEGGTIPLDALNEAGAEGWRVLNVHRNAAGELLRVLFGRR